MSEVTKKCRIPGCDHPTEKADRNRYTLCRSHRARKQRGIKEDDPKFYIPIKTHDELKEHFSKKYRVNPALDDLSNKILKLIQDSNTISLLDLTDKLDTGISKVRAAIEELRGRGMMVNVKDDSVTLQRSIEPSTQKTVIDISKFKKQEIRFGVVADTHLCSKYSREDCLNAMFDIFFIEKIKDVYVLGNIVDGEDDKNRNDLLVAPGLESQMQYLIENWPKRNGIVSHILTAQDHEGWWVKKFGVDVGKIIEDHAISSGRKDMVYIGHMEHDIEYRAKNGSTWLRLAHPGGGTGYALSYQPQQTISSYQGGEKPAICLFGHWHKFEMNYWREVWNVSCGGFQDQTPWARQKRLQYHVGGLIISFTLDDNGIVHNFTPVFNAFYDRGFYEGKNWKYHWK